jgi:hypothetical protein
LGRTLHSPGEVVTLIATPDNPSEVVIWTGTDDDSSNSRYNTVTMNAHRGVTVEFYTPQVFTVPGDFTDIQSAIGAARLHDIVKVSSGVYQGGLIYIDKEITITSTNPDDPCVVAATVIDSSGYASPALIFLPGATQNTVFDGFTIRGGTYYIIDAQNTTTAGQNGYDGGPIGGGAVLIYYGASPTIKNCVIRDTDITGGNASDGADADATVPAGRGGWAGGSYGGGVYIASNASPTLVNCTITNCIARGGNAGNGGNSAGTYPGAGYRDANYGGSWSNDETFPWQSLVGSDGQPYFDDYWYYSGLGGGVFCDSDSSATFIACNITNNTALGGMSGIGGNRPWVRPDPVTAYRIPSYGGGVFCANDCNVRFIDCNIAGNTSPRPDDTYHLDPYLGHGGGIAFGQTAHIEFINCNITDNDAAVGGGMYWVNGDPQVIDCNIAGNTAYVGGGIYGTESTGLIQGCIVHGNFAGVSQDDVDNVIGQGGGIYSDSMGVEIFDCSISDNEAAASGGGIFFTGVADPPIVKNCLITNNFAGRDGGGISANWYSEPNIINCTIADNKVTGTGFETGYGGGVYCSYNSYVNIINSIIWNNSGNIGAQGAQLALATGFKYDPRPSTLNVTYSDIQDATDPNAFGAKITSLDLVFCIDTTGSMADDINAVKAAANQITNAVVVKIPDSRIAVVGYKDFNQPPYGGDTDYPYRTVLGFTTNTSEVVTALNSLTASGGGDTPESVYTALMHSIDHNSLAATLAGTLYGGDPNSMGPGVWRHGNVMRVIILMGDAPPHDPEPFTNYTLEDIVAAAGGAEPKRIVPLLIGEDAEAADYFTSLASGTGGTVLQAAGAEQVVEALMDAIDLISRIPNPVFVDANCIFNWDSNSYSWDPNSHNIDKDPCFVAGYYLRQVRAGQDVNSPCVDSGSADANDPNINLDTYTTATNSVLDVNIVDMGYHYKPFTVPQYELTINAIGVSIIEPNIYAPGYDGFYNWYTTVPLKIGAYDANNYQVQWTGTDNDSLIGPNNTVTMYSDESITVQLIKTRYNLTIDVNDGNGHLFAEWDEDSSSYAIGDPCTHSVKFGTVVQLTAEPNEYYRVRKWSGTDNDATRARTNTVTMDSDRIVEVEFGPPVTSIVPADYPTIQEAVSAAEVGDTIVVYSGTYEGNIDLQGKGITLVSANHDDPNVIAETIIDCGENGRGFIFNSGEDVNTIVNGFIVINGNVIDGNDGGGIFIDSGSSPTIMNMVISNCNADGDPNNPGFGGGIYINADSNPLFINCDIINCSADSGGGAFCDSSTSPTFRHCTFSDNLADLGGGLFCGSDSSTTIIDCNFANNDANNGGSLYGELDSSVTIDESIFTDNTASGYGGALFWFGWMEIFDSNFVGNSSLYGGGMFCAYSEETTIVGCTIRQNRAGPVFDPNIDGKGGGIFCFAAPALVRDCNISYNTANASGGAIYLAGSSDSQQLSNCLITNNFAGRDGGGVSVNWFSKPLISNCTFVSNTAPGTFGEPNHAGLGGGLYTSYNSTTEVIDCIFWDNYAFKGDEIVVGTGFEYDPKPSTVTVSYSDVMGGQSYVFRNRADGQILSQSNRYRQIQSDH